VYKLHKRFFQVLAEMDVNLEMKRFAKTEKAINKGFATIGELQIP